MRFNWRESSRPCLVAYKRYAFRNLPLSRCEELANVPVRLPRQNYPNFPQLKFFDEPDQADYMLVGQPGQKLYFMNEFLCKAVNRGRRERENGLLLRWRTSESPFLRDTSASLLPLFHHFLLPSGLSPEPRWPCRLFDLTPITRS